jgi:Tfp pilus assembly protein PilN
VIGLLAIAVAMVTLYVLSNNTVSQRKAQLAGLNEQVSRMQAQVSRLQSYEKFEKLAQARETTVKQIASGRFDWQAALSDLSKVVPTNTKLQSLNASVSPSSGGGNGALRGAINAPAFSLQGCTQTQDDVAQLMSRLRVMNGVSRVSLESSTAASPTSASSTASAGTGSCAGPTFNMVVFFQPLTGEAATLAGVPSTTPAATTSSTTGAAK